MANGTACNVSPCKHNLNPVFLADKMTWKKNPEEQQKIIIYKKTLYTISKWLVWRGTFCIAEPAVAIWQDLDDLILIEGQVQHTGWIGSEI